MIKIFDSKNDCDCEVEALFRDFEDYRNWSIEEKYFQGRELIAKPTAWRPLDV